MSHAHNINSDFSFEYSNAWYLSDTTCGYTNGLYLQTNLGNIYLRTEEFESWLLHIKMSSKNIGFPIIIILIVIIIVIIIVVVIIILIIIIIIIIVNLIIITNIIIIILLLSLSISI